MKRTATFVLIFMFVLAGFPSAFGQRSADIRLAKRLVAAGIFEHVRAISDGPGVLVRWNMKTETGVSAYDVYRRDGADYVRVTPNMIAGSAARHRERVAYGEQYQFFDLDGSTGSEYLVEGLALDGRRFRSKPVITEGVKSVEAEVGTSSEVFARARVSTNANIENRSATLTGELKDLVGLYEQEPDPEMQQWVASRPGAKIMVRKDGFYRVPAAQLSSAGFPVASDPTKWRLFMNGVEQAIIVGPNAQYIEFYGKGLETAETDIRYYYLIADGVEGKRIGTKVLRAAVGAATARRFPVVAGKKERVFFDPTILNGPEENYFGGIFNDNPGRINFNLNAIDETASTARLDVSCVGFTINQHQVSVKINGHDLTPAFTQFGRVPMSGSFQIPISFLQEGTNQLELRSSAAGDQILFDKVEVSYDRRYVAELDKLSFSTPGYKRVAIEGFSSPSVRVFDVTFDGNPVLISNVSVAEGTSGYTASIPSSRVMVGYALDDSALLQSPGILMNTPSLLSLESNEADMLIISDPTPSFLAVANSWADYRRSSLGGGLNTRVISIADVYDEFNYGTSGADAIRSFLEYATENWTKAPKYVLLIGDTTYDPRNYEGFGYLDLVPSKNVPLILGESVSDEALGDFDDDGLSDIAIGRIAARNATQITTAFNKTKNFELNQQNYNRGALFAHDIPIGFDFEAMNVQMSQELPAGTPVSMVSSGDTNAGQTLIQRMNEGKLLVNYSGHGAVGLWSGSSFFSNSSVPQLTNLDNPSIYVMLTCLSGYFVRPNGDSLSETLLFAPGGGAAAAWASTSETTPDIQLAMGLRFAEQMSSGNLDRIGDLIRDAKTVIPSGADVRLSWVLHGDPALKVP